MSTPDFTVAQFVAVVQAVIAAAVSFSVPLSGDQQKSLLALAAIIGAVLVWADVKLRKHRAENADKIAAAKKLERGPTVIGEPLAPPPAAKKKAAAKS